MCATRSYGSSNQFGTSGYFPSYGAGGLGSYPLSGTSNKPGLCPSSTRYSNYGGYDYYRRSGKSRYQGKCKVKLMVKDLN